jgi:hypothetical protein
LRASVRERLIYSSRRITWYSLPDVSFQNILSYCYIVKVCSSYICGKNGMRADIETSSSFS